MTARIRRSFLYAPADNPELMRKTARTDADAVIFDLEDAIHESNLIDSRRNVHDVMGAVAFDDKEVCVRVNGVRTDHWLADVETAIESGCDTIKLPMVEESWQVRVVSEVLDQHGADDVEIVLTLETPTGLFNGQEIAEISSTLDNVTGLSFGLGDYTNEIGAVEYDTNDQNLPIRNFLNHFLVGFAAIGRLDPIASVHTEIEDSARLRAIARTANEIGFIGQSAIHPRQVRVINEVFTPPEDDVRRLEELLEAYDETDLNSMVVDGTFLDEAIVKRFERRIDRFYRISGTAR